MKKIAMFLSSLLLILAGCSNEELGLDDEKASVDIRLDKVRWYGAHLFEGVETRGVADGAKRWNQNVGIYIKFLNAPANPQTLTKVKQIASEWENYAGIKFHFVESDKKADVRIAFNWNGNDWLTWSYTGNEAKYERNQNQPTAVFGGLDELDEETFKGDVLRLFGQILGLEYEQRHQEWSQKGYWKSESQLRNYWISQFEDTGFEMDWDEIREYVFDPLTEANASLLMETREIDEQSVMAWPYYNIRQTSKLLANCELSEGDKAFIATLYPKNGGTLPTIQEAWVDAGYFVWTDATKTSLRMTDLGRAQEYFPDVCDGEQLTSVANMFVETGLKAVPQFNTDNVTNFSSMVNGCDAVTTVPDFNTSKGTIFSSMLSGCSKLTTIPEFDTSNGTDFSGMLSGCSSVTIIPDFNTSKGTNFSSMLSGCSKLTTIPEFDTSNGTDFSHMLSGCSALTTVPNFDTSNGTKFNFMFSTCSALTTVPNLDTSNGTDFSNMFVDCSTLTTIPNLDTSNGTDFNWMFYACSALTTIPHLNTSNGTNFNYMFNVCSALISIPDLNTSKGIKFFHMFAYCSSLTAKPNLDLSNALEVRDMYIGTPFE